MIKFINLENIHSIIKERIYNEDAIDMFFSKKQDICRFLIGRNEQAKFLIDNFEIDAIIDDFSSGTWYGKKIINSNIPKNSIVVNCSTSIGPISAERCLSNKDNVNIIAYSELFYSNPEKIEAPKFVDEARYDIISNYDKYNLIFNILNDDLSREIFNDLIRYRLTADYNYMRKYSIRLNDQYFEKFLGDLKGSIFVDCGGFDGDTTEEFCKRYPEYKKVFLFEPSQKNIESAKKRLKEIRDINIIKLGVSDESGILSFNPNSGSASSISEDGSDFINVTTLDEFIQEPVSFIKMDLEGWELPALKGASNQIEDNSPILAISVYHSISDFWKIPEFILDKNGKYNIYLRHYTEGWSETVMYFLPK